MLVVADTSALLALAACESLELLDALFHEVRVPPAVFRECTEAGKPSADVLGSYLRERVAEVNLEAFVIAAAGLGRGELEAMALGRCRRGGVVALRWITWNPWRLIIVA